MQWNVQKTDFFKLQIFLCAAMFFLFGGPSQSQNWVPFDFPDNLLLDPDRHGNISPGVPGLSPDYKVDEFSPSGVDENAHTGVMCEICRMVPPPEFCAEVLRGCGQNTDEFQ